MEGTAGAERYQDSLASLSLSFSRLEEVLSSELVPAADADFSPLLEAYQTCKTHLEAFESEVSKTEGAVQEFLSARLSQYQSEMQRVEAGTPRWVEGRAVLLDERKAQIDAVRDRILAGENVRDLKGDIDSLWDQYDRLSQVCTVFKRNQPLQDAHDRVLVGFEGLLEVVQQKEDEERVAKVCDQSPLESLYMECQKLMGMQEGASIPIVQSNVNKQVVRFLDSFQALGTKDQAQFIESVFPILFTEKDHEEFIRNKYSASFKEIDRIPLESARQHAVAAMVSVFKTSTTMTAIEKHDWVMAHLGERLGKLPEAMEAFVTAKLGLIQEDQEVLFHKTARQIAIDEGIEIADWDQEWSKYHLKDDAEGRSPWTRRAIRALSAIDAAHRQNELERVMGVLSGDPSTLMRILKYSDAIQALREGRLDVLSHETLEDLKAKRDILMRMKEAKLALSRKYPEIELHLADSAHPLFRLWKQQELFFLLYPSAPEGERAMDMLRMAERLELRMSALLTEEHTPTEAAFLLETALKQLARHPRPEILNDAICLRDLEAKAQVFALQGGFPVFEGSCFKDIYVLRSEDGSRIVGKYKPNLPGVARKEEATYDYDRLMGLNATSPTAHVRLSLRQGLLNIKEKFLEADVCQKNAEALRSAGERGLAHFEQERAEALHKQAFDLCSKCHGDVLQGLYYCLQTRLTTEARDGVGHDMWWNVGGCLVPDSHRAAVIDDYLVSAQYHTFVRSNAFEAGHHQGSLQKWIQRPGRRMFDLMLEDPKAGERLMAMPKSIVHLYCILGIVKGSKDGSMGNTMVLQSPSGEYIDFADFDDEKSMPTENNYKQLRMWQFGLPQADEPFDRSVLLMFAEPEFLGSVLQYHRLAGSSDVSPGSYKALEDRVRGLSGLFREELRKDTPTLTPRELFFHLFGGREEFEHWHVSCELNPLHVFEYCMGQEGAGGYFAVDNYRTTLNENFESLYGQPKESRVILERVLSEHPNAQTIVRCSPDRVGGSPLYIRGSGLGLNWDTGEKMTYIGDDIWIWERAGIPPQDGLEYKILLDDTRWEFGIRNHTVHGADRRLVDIQFVS
jgi:hypothetical protein